MTKRYEYKEVYTITCRAPQKLFDDFDLHEVVKSLPCSGSGNPSKMCDECPCGMVDCEGSEYREVPTLQP